MLHLDCCTVFGAYFAGCSTLVLAAEVHEMGSCWVDELAIPKTHPAAQKAAKQREGPPMSEVGLPNFRAWGVFRMGAGGHKGLGQTPGEEEACVL